MDNREFIPRRDFEQHLTVLSVFSSVKGAREALASLNDDGVICIMRADVLQPGRLELGSLSDMIDADERAWPRYHLAQGLAVLVVDVPSEHAWTACCFLVEIAHSPRTLILAPRPGRAELEVRTPWRASHAAA